MTDATLQHRAARLVSREVLCCLSGLVAALAPHWGALDLSRDTSGLSDLIEQAGELCAPLPDYESAAREAGWQWDDGGPHFSRNPPGASAFAPYDYQHVKDGNWQTLCGLEDIEPHDREVYEHWAVSDWLADHLEAKGEKVDRDFAGLTVWARTTTGQAIKMDAVIEAITIETGYASGGEG